MAKNLILYYSRKGENYVNGSLRTLAKGNTEICAEFIRKAVGGDLFEIETVRAYSPAYMTCIEEAKAELREKARPELKACLDSIADYDNIFVCGPCWWGTYPCAVFGQLEKLHFRGKHVFPVMTHEGSGMGSSERDIEKACRGAELVNSLAVSGSQAQDSKKRVSDWALKCLQ